MVDTETFEFSPSFFLFFSCIVIFPGSCLKAVFRSTTILSFFQNRFFYYINFDYNVFFSFLSPWNKLSSRLLTSIIILRIPAIDRNLGWNDRPIFFFFHFSTRSILFQEVSIPRNFSFEFFASSSTKPFNPIKKKNGRDGFYRSRNLVSKRPFDKRAIYQRSERSWSYLMSSWNFFFIFYFFFLFEYRSKNLFRSNKRTYCPS